MKIIPLNAFNDNYIWMIVHQGHAIAVDPGEAPPVLNALAKENVSLSAILVTHHHLDHCGGVAELKQTYPNAIIYAPLEPRLPHTVDCVVHDGQVIEILGLKFTVMDVPAHTSSHVAYYGEGVLFSGDTLFSAGCGRLFEGTPDQMYTALQRFMRLPSATKVYCGHEYTLSNLRFAAMADPLNPEVLKYQQISQSKRDAGLPTLPSTIGIELQVNPFMRCSDATVQAAAEKASRGILDNPIAVLAALRTWKNQL